MNRYRDAYRAMSINDLKAVAPDLPRELYQALDRQFKNCRLYDLTFGNMQVSMADDPTSATVNVRTNYSCTPKTGQAPPSQDQQDVFLLRKVDSEWLIESTGSLDSGRRR